MQYISQYYYKPFMNLAFQFRKEINNIHTLSLKKIAYNIISNNTLVTN